MRTTTLVRPAAVGLGLSLLLAIGGPPASGEVPKGRVSENTRFQPENKDPLRGRDIPGIAVDPATGGRSAHLVVAYYYYPDASCGSNCQLDV
ncbi:MAG TPA: hypothetical protein VL337_16005, partial [Acidimicrobiales bacterium]|nr:hypothetical protein [Acidimicrobiales bacterium]